MQYVTANTPKPARYIQIYKQLLVYAIQLNLNLTAVLLYALLRSRAMLSYERGWFDDAGHIYVIYARHKFAADIGISKQSSIKAFHSLIEAGLIEEISRKNRNNCTLAPLFMLNSGEYLLSHSLLIKSSKAICSQKSTY